MSDSDNKFGLGQLRHLYAQMASGLVGDQKAAAKWLLAPGIQYAENLEKELDRVKREGTPGVLHEVDKAFYDLTVKERDAAWRELDQLRARLARTEAEFAKVREDLHYQVKRQAEAEEERRALARQHYEELDAKYQAAKAELAQARLAAGCCANCHCATCTVCKCM